MVVNCVAVGCHNYRGKKPGLSYHRFPADRERREKWVAALRRADSTNTRSEWRPTATSRICNEHFVGGAASNDPLSPAYIPSIFKHVPSPKKRKAERAMESYKRRKNMLATRRKNKQRDAAAGALLDLQDEPVPSTSKAALQECTQAPNTLPDIPGDSNPQESEEGMSEESSVEKVCADKKALTADDISLREDNRVLQNKIKELSLDESILSDQNRVKCYTGLPSGEVLKIVYEQMEEYLSSNSALSKFQQLLLTLMRLRLNQPLQYLAYTFGVHVSTLSCVFNSVLDVLYVSLLPLLVFWPEREVLRKTLPISFREKFSKGACIIDCFEIFIERPSDLRARAETYSNYKHHNTMKYLIGITPQGTISFVSNGWGGRASDKHITGNCGFLMKLLPGDLILADRGFTVAESVSLYSAQLKIPAFTKGKNQLSATDVETTRTLASRRIHVERVIGLAKQKYTILDSAIPITLLQTDNNGKVTTLDKIVRVACGLCNLCESVVPFE